MTEIQSVNSSQFPVRQNFRFALFESVAGSALLCSLAFWAQWKYGFNWADEGLLWYVSQRTALGEVPIRDFFSYDPGRYYWSSMFFYLTGGNGLFNLLISNAVFGAIGLAVAWLAMCRAGINWKWRVLGAILITVALGYPRHKVFEQSLSLIAVAAVFFVLLKPEQLPRWAAFGILTGLAAFMGRNHGVYFLVSALICGGFIYFSDRKILTIRLLIVFLGGVVLGYSPMLFMLAIKPGFFDAFISSILFTPNWQLPLPIPFPWRLNLLGLPPVDSAQQIATSIACIVIPLIYLFGIIFSFRELKKTTAKNYLLILLTASSIVGIPYLHSAFGRADFGHIAQSILPVFPAAIVSTYYFKVELQLRLLAMIALTLFSLMILISWLPKEPAISFARFQHHYPNHISKIFVDGKSFKVAKAQADLLNAVGFAFNICHVEPNEFWAAPHFPGIYAYFNAKAPFWEMFYLYERSPELQKEHISAMGETRLVLLAPEATVDGLERLKLKNTYGLLLEYIQRRYVELRIPGVPRGYKLYVLPSGCK